MYALEKAVQEKPVKITSVYIGEENHFDDGTVQDRFVVTLEYQGRKMSIDFYMGIGHRVFPKYFAPYGELAGKPVPFHLQNKLIARHAKPVLPKVENVLYCLLSDSTALDLTFEEWCAELGYDEDSKKAEKIFNQCNDQGKQLKRLLGKDYQYFMENNEY